jgi:outer membrane protein
MTRAMVLAVLLTATPALLPAQAVPARMTLADALEIARQHNASLNKARSDQHVAGMNTLQSYGQLMPNASASLGFSGSNSTTLTGQDEFGRPVRLDDPTTFQSSSASQSVSLSVPIFDPRLLRGVAVAKAQERSVDGRLAVEERRLEAAVTRAFYDAMRLERQIELEQRLLAAAADNLERSESLLRIAAASHADVIGARIQVASAEQSLARAEGEAAKGRLRLLEAMGVGGGPEFTAVGDLPAAFDPATLAVEPLVEHAQAAGPGVQVASANLAAARHRTASARSSRLPTLRANAGYGRSMGLRSYDAFFQMNPQNRSLNFGLSASVPLFSGFQVSSNIASANAQEYAAREDERIARNTAAREVRTAHIDLVNAYRTLELSRTRVELERERLAMAEEQYRQGSLTYVVLQQYIDQAANAERQAVDALFGFATALAGLEEKAATPLRR